MSRTAFLLLWVSCTTTAAFAAVLIACGDDTTPVGNATPDGGSTDGGGGDSGGGNVDSSSNGGDAGAKTTCEITKKYFEDCGNEADLNCGDNFDAWCAQNDKVINSAAYRTAQALCLKSPDNCDGKKRRDCEYTHYNSETPTASEKALVAAYCQTCEPSDIAGCTTRATKYDPSKGIGSVGDIYVAAWELADPLCDEIKTKCTGGAVDAGPSPDASACAKTFGGCSADIYLAALPDCPK